MDYKKIYKTIEKRYVIWMLILATLFMTRQAVIQYQISLGKDMSKLINASGKQRMRSQKISKDIFRIYTSENRDEKKEYLKELESTTNNLERTQVDLTNVDEKASLRGRNSGEIRGKYIEAEPYFQNILASARRVLEITREDKYNKNLIVEEIKTINENEKVFLEIMDDIVCQYDFESQETMLLIERTEWFLFFAIILTIIMITFFSFYPLSKAMKYALREIDISSDNIKKLFYSMKGILFLVHENGDIMMMNSDAEEMIKLDERQDRKLNIKEDVDWIDLDIIKVIDQAEMDKASERIETMIRDKEENIINILLSVTAGLYNGKQTVLISAADISMQKEAEKLLKDKSNRDELSGLYNRRYLESIIDSEFKRAERYNYSISAAILDIDNFKAINDNWGHPVGDLVIKEISHILRANARQSDSLIRIGGEEFVILMPHTDLEGAYSAAEKFRKSIEEANNPVVGSYTASFGVGERKASESYDELYFRIDQALYKAKDLGKNQTWKSY